MSNQNTYYECVGFSDALAKGKASGTMTIDANILLFQIQEQHIRMPLQGIEVSLGGASNRLVFFEHPFVKGWSFYTSDRRILSDAHLANQPAIINTLMQAKRKHFFGWMLIALVTFVTVALPLLLVLRMDLATAMIAKKIPLEWEEKIGETTIAQYQLGKEVMTSKQTETLLNPLVTPLLASLNNSQYHYKFHIVNDGTLNAFALPGGQVVVHSALILRAESAEELLGVLAHEIMHIEQQHGLRNVIGASGIYLIASAVFGDVSGLLAVLGSAAPLLLNQSYSRGFETESDVKGFELLVDANINPSGLASFFEKMLEEEKEQLEKIDDENNRELIKTASRFLSTHPASEDRIEKLNELIGGVSPQVEYIKLDLQFIALQNAVKQFVTEKESENSRSVASTIEATDNTTNHTTGDTASEKRN